MAWRHVQLFGLGAPAVENAHDHAGYKKAASCIAFFPIRVLNACHIFKMIVRKKKRNLEDIQVSLCEQRFGMTLWCTVGLLIGFRGNSLISSEIECLLLHGESYSCFTGMDTAVPVVCELEWIVD
jgi:hypothetical protein